MALLDEIERMLQALVDDINEIKKEGHLYFEDWDGDEGVYDPYDVSFFPHLADDAS